MEEAEEAEPDEEFKDPIEVIFNLPASWKQMFEVSVTPVGSTPEHRLLLGAELPAAPLFFFSLTAALI